MKNGKAKYLLKKGRPWGIATLATGAVLLTVSLLATNVLLFKNTLITVFGDYRVVPQNSKPEYVRYHTDEGIETKKDAYDNANRVNDQINEEGYVLLKNEGKALPLSEGSKITVLGKNSVNLVYGGSGSSQVNPENAVTLYQSLRNAGFQVNEEAERFYESDSSGEARPFKAPDMGTELQGYPIYETPADKYTDSVKNSFKEYGDAAIVVLSRIGGEGFDLPRKMEGVEGADPSAHYLELDNNEKALLKLAEENFDKVVLVINSAAPLELGFLEDSSNPDYSDKIKAALWIGNPGAKGVDALGKVLKGEVNPSGRLVDTYARDFTKGPTWNNFGDNLTAGTGHRYTLESGDETNAYFIDYEEGIYVGYRYYETRGHTDGEDWYQENVVFPFGYGLSYTDFSWRILSSTPTDNASLTKDGDITIQVEVTNEGDVAGKDVVELYFIAPYYDDGIEKSHVVLGDFAKTETIEPGQSKTVTLTVNPFDMASYDFDDRNGNGFKGYELEGGDYTISIGRNAHDLVDGITLHLSQEDSGLQDAVHGKNGFVYREDPVTHTEIVNRFDDVSSHIETYLSRSDWEGTWPSVPTAQDKVVSDEFIESLSAESYIGEGRDIDKDKPWYTNKMPKFARESVAKEDMVQLYELIGKDYDDPLWDELLDNLTLKEMAYLIGTGNFNTARMDNISKPKTIDPDGPAGFTNFMAAGDAGAVYETCSFACECLIGATWNKQLAYDMGVAVGNEALIGNARGDGQTYSGWYAPAVNIHRSPFSGRNFEYYSEDGMLNGLMGAALVQGANTKGVYTYVKHFALNDQETQRGGVCTWASEQAMREIYFKPFEKIVKVGKTHAMMSSFNRIGTVWTGGSYELLTEILRQEWGFVGMVITDYNTYEHMPADQMIRAGGDLNLFQDKQPSTSGGNVTASHVQAMRNAAHNILYTVANSNAMNRIGEGVTFATRLPVWMEVLYTVDGVVVGLLFLTTVVFVVLANFQYDKAEKEGLTEELFLKKTKKERK